jgi:ribosomal-protein-alanine N-acetyltransferase
MMDGRQNVIRTKRLMLRQFQGQDMEAYVRMMGDREVGKWFPKGDGYTREEARRSLDAILKHWNQWGFGIWALVGREDPVLRGRCGFNRILETSEIEVDFVLARNYWRKGYATEAAEAVLAYGFNSLNFDRIIALAKPDNVASRRVIEKIGLRYQHDAEYWGITCAYFTLSRAAYTQRSAQPRRG